jgi:hypothetical protein
MDVYDLAPALLAFGNMLREANNTVNGESATVSIYVRADIEARCFFIKYEIVQTLFQNAIALATNAKVAGAKEIVEWAMAAWDLYKIFGRREEGSLTTVEDANERGKVVLAVPGNDNTVSVNNNTYNIYLDKNFQRETARVFKPLEREGIENAKIDVEGYSKSFDKKEAANIIEACTPALTDEIEPQVVTAWLTVYAPKYDQGAKTWQFKWGAQKITVDISKTDIAKETLKRGAAFVGDRYKADMQIEQDRQGRVTYKVIKVHEGRRGPQQVELLDEKDLDDE